MNTVQITGNLAKDPIIRATKTGKAVASFSVGVSKRITKTNGDILDLTDWVNVTAWGKLAEAVGNELTKRSYVFIAQGIFHQYYKIDDDSADDDRIGGIGSTGK